MVGTGMAGGCAWQAGTAAGSTHPAEMHSGPCKSL